MSHQRSERVQGSRNVTVTHPSISHLPFSDNLTRSASSAEHQCKAKQESCTGGCEAAEERLSLCKALPQPL